jgi:hypothetical protein
MKTHKFYKEDNVWYIDIPNYPFPKSTLAMVLGADELLDKLSNHGKEITINFSTKEFEGQEDVLIRTNKLGITEGAIYMPVTNHIKHEMEGNKNRLWLCPVTLYVFGKYPKQIYYSVVKN